MILLLLSFSVWYLKYSQTFATNPLYRHFIDGAPCNENLGVANLLKKLRLLVDPEIIEKIKLFFHYIFYF